MSSPDTGPIMCIWCEEILPTKAALQVHQMDNCKKNPMSNLLAKNLEQKYRIIELEARVEELEIALEKWS